MSEATIEGRGFRLHAQDYTGWRSKNPKQRHPPVVVWNLRSKAEAETKKRQIIDLAEQEDRTVVAVITAVPEPQMAQQKVEKIGPGHPEWQGAPRLTR